MSYVPKVIAEGMQIPSLETEHKIILFDTVFFLSKVGNKKLETKENKKEEVATEAKGRN